ncbi:MAG TPA: universal stress protein [Halobacteriales archaeon]|nr:universal stress protein [Halobacteriales archaeon]
MYRRILVPTDGSETAAAAMEEAIDLASTDSAEVHVLHVIDSWHYDTSIESAVEPLREEAEPFVERLAGMAEAAGVPVATAIEVGRPAHHVLEYADDHDVDLIVLGTRGRGGLPRRLLGSVTQYVVAHAEVPVHVVPAAE